MSQLIQTAPPVPFAGEIASLAAALIWSCTMSIFTVFGRGVPAQTLNLFKNVVAVTCLVIAAVVLRPQLPGDYSVAAILAVSGVIGLSLGDTALFAALKRLGAQVTSASQCLAPPIAALVAALFLDETLSPRELSGLFVTAGAVAAIIYFGNRQGAHLSTLPKKTLVVGLLFALLAAICQATGIVLQRQALQNVHVVYGTIMRIAPAVLVLGGLMMTAPASAPQAMRTVFVSRKQTLLLALASFGGTCLGLLLLSVGAKYTKAGIAAALTSTYPIWIIPIARFVLKEKVSWQSTLFTVVAVGGIILMVA